MATSGLTERGRRTRRRIVEATAQHIQESGIGGTRLDDVLVATATSKSQLFHYFPRGKAELVREVVAWEGERLDAAQRPALDEITDWASWERWCAALHRYYFDEGAWLCPISSLAAEASSTDPELAQGIVTGLAAWRDSIAAGLARVRDAGQLDPAAEPHRLATAVVAAVQGGLMLAQVERDGAPLRAALDTTYAGIRSFALPA